MTVLISTEETTDLLTVRSSIPVIEEMFRAKGRDLAENSERFEMPAGDGYLLFRAGSLAGQNRIGFKLLSSFGSGPRQMWNFLYDTGTGELLAIVQSRAISKMRTAAASAVAVRHLSPENADTVGMFGTGRQAETQLAAICSVRPVRSAIVYSRNAEKRGEFCRRMSAELGIDVRPADAPELVPQAARIIVTITNAETPVLLGQWLRSPSLIVAVGANEWNEREIDHEVVARADLVVVDDLEDAKAHCGDLRWAEAKDAFTWKQAVELGDVVAGEVKKPDLSNSIVLFESQGIALEDVAVTSAVYDAAMARGLGREVRL